MAGHETAMWEVATDIACYQTSNAAGAQLRSGLFRHLTEQPRPHP